MVSVIRWATEKARRSNDIFFICFEPKHREGNWICEVIAFVGLIVLVIGLGLEISGHHKEIRITDTESRRLTSELSNAKITAGRAEQEAGIANEIASSNALEVAQANERVENERLARAELETDLAIALSPRRLVIASDAVAKLAQMSNTTAMIWTDRTEWPGGDSFSLAEQIAYFLRAAHWNLVATNIPDDWVWPANRASVEVQVNDRPISGLIIGNGTKEVAALAGRTVQAGKMLVNELNNGGLDSVSGRSRMHLPEGIVLVAIAKRENPFENKFLEQKLEQRAEILKFTDPKSSNRLKRFVESLQESDKLRRTNPKLNAIAGLSGLPAQQSWC